MIIRKISIGPDYKGAMHYLKGQSVMKDSATIHEIIQKESGIEIWVLKNNSEIYLWKSFTPAIPISIEYNINF
jgi:hypothetical protein